MIVARAPRNVDDVAFICSNAKALLAKFEKPLARCCASRFARRQTPSGVVSWRCRDPLRESVIVGFRPKNASAEAGQDRLKSLSSVVPMGRMGSGDEIAKAAVFLASDDSSFVTGIELFVDGGFAQV